MSPPSPTAMPPPSSSTAAAPAAPPSPSPVAPAAASAAASPAPSRPNAATSHVAPGESLAYRAFKEGLVVWVKFENYPWWPGVVKRRKPSEVQPNREAQLAIRSTRPVLFFNDNKMRYVVDISHMREYSGNVHLIEDSRRVADGSYAEKVLDAVEEANAHLISNGTYEFQRTAIDRPAFRTTVANARQALGLPREPPQNAEAKHKGAARAQRKRSRSDSETGADDAPTTPPPPPPPPPPTTGPAVERADTPAPTVTDAPASERRPWARPRRKKASSETGARVASPVTPGRAPAVVASGSAVVSDSDSLSAMQQNGDGRRTSGNLPLSQVVAGSTLAEQRQRLIEEQREFELERVRLAEMRRQFSAERAAFNLDRARLAATRDEVREDREHSQNEAHRLREELARLREELEVVREENARQAEADRERAKRLARLREEERRTEEDLRRFNTEVAALAEQQEKFKRDRPGIEMDIRRAQKEADEARASMKAEIEALEKAREGLRMSREKQRENHNLLRENHTTLLKRCKELKNIRDMLKMERAAKEGKAGMGMAMVTVATNGISVANGKVPSASSGTKQRAGKGDGSRSSSGGRQAKNARNSNGSGPTGSKDAQNK